MRSLLYFFAAGCLSNAIFTCVLSASFARKTRTDRTSARLPRPHASVCDESYGLMNPDNCRHAVQEMPSTTRQNVFGNWDVPGILVNYQLPQWFSHGERGYPPNGNCASLRNAGDCVIAVFVNLYPDDVGGYLEPGADTDIFSWGEIQLWVLSLVNRCSTVPAPGGGLLTKGGYDIGGE